MQQNSVIVITGAAGFIGSYLVGYLNRAGFNHLILVDDFSRTDKTSNLEGKTYDQRIERSLFIDWLNQHPGEVNYIFHLGARTDTTEPDYNVHKALNVDYSKGIWEACTAQNIPLVYASSAATYGNGELGYTDRHDIVKDLQPLNAYGRSKNDFDIWALEQKATPPFWAGVKFFNVFGPNEYHKGRMASVIFHSYNRIQQEGNIRLFRSHNPKYKDGEQLRDFIYVKDIVSICTWLMEAQPESGLYNAGTGKARTFIDLAKAIFASLQLPEQIEFVDTPEDIRDKYQYFTEADTAKLLRAGYNKPFHSLEQATDEYIKNYLKEDKYF